MTSSIYDFDVNLIDGTKQSIEAYRGKVILIVNTASQCGFTHQYAGLESLYQHFKEQATGLLGTEAIKWNFTKFLVNRNGEVIDRYAPTTKPDELIPIIESLLA